MKKGILVIISSIILSMGIAHAENNKPGNLDISGSTTINKQNYNSINVNGNLKASQITATGPSSISGHASFTNSQLSAVAVSGATSFKNSQINGKVDISGGLNVNQSSIKGSALDCSGNITSYKSDYNLPIDLSGGLETHEDTFNGPLVISGEVKADKSIFNQTITISSLNSEWKNSTVNTNIINETRAFLSTPTITLDNTQVNGKIVFTKSKGLIILKGTSKVSGPIENAEIKKG